MQPNNATPKADWNCEVCGVEPAAAAVAVPGMPVTAAYGRACLDANAHPYGLLVANTACIGGYELAAEWWQQMVTDTLRRLNKTQQQFDADVADAAMKVFEQMMAEAEQGRGDGE